MRRDLGLRFPVLAAAAVLIASCANQPTSPASTADAALCRPDHFQAFLARFSEDTEFQKVNTASRLQTFEVLNESPEPRDVEKVVKRSDVEFPVFIDAASRKKGGLEMTSAQEGPRMRVKIEKPDTDILMFYVFEHHGCWQLVRKENHTL